MNDLKGIFVVYRYIDNLTNKVFYIGKTKDLVSRCKTHSKESSFARFNDFRIEYIICNDEPSALYYELAYIIKYKPCLNKYGNGKTELKILNLPESWVEYYNTNWYNDIDLQPETYVVDKTCVWLVCSVLSMNDDLTKLRVLINTKTGRLVNTFLDINLSGEDTIYNHININVLDSDSFYIDQLYSDMRKGGLLEIDYFCLSTYNTICKYPYVWFDVSIEDNTLILQDSIYGYEVRFEIISKPFLNGVIKDSITKMNRLSDFNFDFDEDGAKIVYDSIMRLRDEVNRNNNLAFGFVKNEFTLSDLQRIYEIVLDKKLYKSNFKNSLVGKIESLDRKGVSIVGHKKSELYRYTG